MPEVVSPQKKRSSTEKVQITPDSKVDDYVTADGSLNKQEKTETIEMEFKSPKDKQFKQKSLKDQECVTESTSLESETNNAEFSSLYPKTKDFESRSLSSEGKITGSSSVSSKSKNTKSDSLMGEEDIEMKSPEVNKNKIFVLHSTKATTGTSNKRGLSPTEEPLRVAEKKKRVECSDKSVQVSDKIGSFIAEDQGKTYLATSSSQNSLVKEIFEKVNPLPDMLKFQESMQTFMLDSQFKLDPDLVGTPEKLSKSKDTGGKLYALWRKIKENLRDFDKLVQPVIPKFGLYSKLTPEELEVCINDMKKSTNEMKEYNKICVEELRNWWNLTKVFDIVFFLHASLCFIYSKVEKIESKFLADKNSELSSSNFKSRCMNSKLSSNAESEDSETCLTTADTEMKSPNEKECKQTCLISTPVINCPTNKNTLSDNEPSKHLKKEKLIFSEEFNQILRQLLYSADGTSFVKDSSELIQNPEALEILEKINLFPIFLKFERTIESFLLFSGLGLEFDSESNPNLSQLWKETEKTVFDFKKQVRAIIAELGPLCELTLTDLKDSVCNLKILTDKMKEPRKACFEELKRWWNLTQVFNDMFTLEASLNDIFSKVKKLDMNT